MNGWINAQAVRKLVKDNFAQNFPGSAFKHISESRNRFDVKTGRFVRKTLNRNTL